MAKFFGGWIYSVENSPGFPDVWGIQFNTDSVGAPLEKPIRQRVDNPQQALDKADEYFGTPIKLEETLGSRLGYRIVVGV